MLAEFANAGFELLMNLSWLTGMTCYAMAAVAVGDPEYAGPLLDKLAPWAGRLATSGITTTGPVSLYLGGLAAVLCRYDDADAYFTEASVTSHRPNAKFYEARTDVWWGRMLAKRQAPADTDKARDLLTKGRTIAVANGYGHVERQAVEALQLLDS
jgi:hypothetical protein